MEKIKLTKMELRSQQARLKQLQNYLPILRLKKALLQFEVAKVQTEAEKILIEMDALKKSVAEYAFLFADNEIRDLFLVTQAVEVRKKPENVAGIEIFHYEGITFNEVNYDLFDTPVWMDSMVAVVKEMVILREKVKIIEDARRALAKELREVSIRVNLFEKVLIPRCKKNIRRIAIFLGDQQLAAVAQAKVAKKKILLREANL